MNHVLAVCDSETEYAYQLADYFSNKKGFPFQVQLFTSSKTLIEYSVNHPISVALIAEKDFIQDIRNYPIDHLLLLGEDGRTEKSELKILYKYQSSEQIIKELLDWIAREGILGRTIADRKELKFFGTKPSPLLQMIVFYLQ